MLGQTDDLITPYVRLRDAPIPRGGWVRAIREALGMTQVQLAARLGIARQSLDDLERAEASGKITLESLRKLADALDCKVVYAVVPNAGSLEAQRRRRALALADALRKSPEHSMKLEAQGISEREAERHRKMLAEALLRGSPRKLWR